MMTKLEGIGRAATRAVLPAFFVTVVIGCATTREATKGVASALISVEQEREIGEQMSAQLEQRVQLLDDPVIQRYVASVGRRVVENAGEIPEGTRFQFKVIDAPDQINAVALPGGFIYVYSGLLRAADSEAELAAVLAHEIAHVADRHIAAQLVAALGLQTLASLALGNDPSTIARIAASVAATGTLLQFSREAEREADELGILFTARAGWSPTGYIEFFEQLAAEQRGGNIPTFLRSHPAPAERIANAQATIDRLNRVPTFMGRDRFRSVVARLDGVVGVRE